MATANEPSATLAPPAALPVPASAAPVALDATSVTDKPGTGSAAAQDAPAGASAPIAAVSLSSLFRFASPLDRLLIGIAVISAVCFGAVQPLQALIIGLLVNATSNPTSFDSTVNNAALYMSLLGAFAFLCGFCASALMFITSERQIGRVRMAYMRAIVRQDAAWYDTHSAGDLASQLAENLITIQAGMGEKLTLVVNGVAQLLGGFILAFSVAPQAWRLALAVLAFVPAIGIVFSLLFAVLQGFSGTQDDAYTRAGRVATEALAMIRTVAAFGGEVAEIARYDAHLVTAQGAGIKRGLNSAVALGVFLFTLNAFYGVALYAGARFIILNREQYPRCAAEPTLADCFAGGTVLQVVFALIGGAASLGIVAPNLTAFAAAKAAARSIWDLIDRVPPIDALSDAGIVKPSLIGRIEFRGVTFAYQSRPTVPVLINFNLTLDAGRTHAFVSPSGGGKSTLVALIMRMYDPQEGSVLVDGVDVREYNVAWLRQQMALVSQEPQLLAGTVQENIALGRVHAPPTHEECIAAAKSANLHDFISSLPSGYDTPVTTSQLSGGQKQRLAIARALIRRVPLLILDESTSALDSQTERAIQADLDRVLSNERAGDAAAQRTVLMVAQRLSTIVNADNIVVLRAGAVVEQGTHAQLLAMEHGVYATLWNTQRMSQGMSSGDLPHVGSFTSAAAASAAVTMTAHVVVDVASSKAVTVAPVDKAKQTSNKKGAEESQDEETLENPVVSDAWKALPRVSLQQLWPFIVDDAAWYIVAMLCALINGVVLPVFALILSRFVAIFFIVDNNTMLGEATKYLIIFLSIGVGCFFMQLLQGSAFAVSGERMTRRLRRAAFTALLRQAGAFFDLPRNSVGRLSTRLGMTASRLRAALGPTLGEKLSSISTLIAGLVVGFMASWRLSLIILACAPLLILSAAAENTVQFGLVNEAKAGYAQAGSIAVEATTNVRVVSAFGLQLHLLQAFAASLVGPTKRAMTRGWLLGTGFGLSQFFQPATTALIFYCGAVFIKQGNTTFGDLLQCYFALQFSTIGLANLGTLASDIASLDGSLRILINTIETPVEPSTDPLSAAGAAVVPSPAGMDIELRGVTFAYPSRATQQVLHGLTMRIPAGSTAAIVGASGAGKSTVPLLLQRMYVPSGGEILLDGVPLADFNLASVRDVIGWVPQEALLWSDSIAYNVGYGRASREKRGAEAGVPLDAPADFKLPAAFTVENDVRAAVTMANASDFVEGFKHGYATHVGERGSQLSGGQKQRIAIARAVVRKPRIVILDESTSALDSVNEEQVQKALDALVTATAGLAADARPTTIIIAHRLKTVRNADVIFVMDAGRVVEQGPFEDLMQAHGVFYGLVKTQDPAAAQAYD